jgi:Protein of unknown function (DUF2948)
MSDVGPMKLRARDAEDLAVISTCLQDALVNVREMKFLPSERRFVFIANRFRWELGAALPERPPAERPIANDVDASFSGEDDDHAHYERIHCGVCFERVRGVKSKGLKGAFSPRFLELLALQVEPGAIHLLFAEAATVRLEVDAIRCYLEDLGEAWPTAWQPAHPTDDAASGER